EKTGAVLGEKMLMVVEAFRHRPVAVWYDVDNKRNETFVVARTFRTFAHRGFTAHRYGLLWV
ncbi:hypothetical protein, partial [Nostoc sp.]|uniref:hypothetical protein n=1 Tax=Nostoc sp. TaxID=1180 RepID=UPI002FF84681